MERPDWAPEGIDMERPSAARVYDYWLGGSHNFAVDRDMAHRVMAMQPDTTMIMQRNRAFLRRAVEYLVSRGVRQFLDLGSGIPTLGNVHEVAQKATADARVVYVDIDPVAVAHSRQILAGDPRTVVLQEDLRNTDAVLAHPEVRGLLDFDEPVAVLLVAVLHFLADAENPAGTIARLRDAVASGSYLAVSHATIDHMAPDAAREWLALANRTPTPVYPRRHADIERLFDGFDVVDPGVVWSSQWHPEHPDDVGEASRSAAYVGVGRKR